MTQVMKGVRVLEVAQFTLRPRRRRRARRLGRRRHQDRASGARRHPARLPEVGGIAVEPAAQHADGAPQPRQAQRRRRPRPRRRARNCSTRSPRPSDVFLTNYLPAQRQKLKFDLEHIRAANPNIIYARGSAYGDKGPEREIGGFDGTAFWTRGGVGLAMSPEELDGPLTQGIPAFGDTIGGMNIAGGIAAALFHRERTGEAIELDVSLLQHGLVGRRRRRWRSAMETGQITDRTDAAVRRPPGQPVHGQLPDLGRRHINLCILTPGPLHPRHLRAPRAARRRPTTRGSPTSQR